MSGREDRDPPDDGDDGRGGDRRNRGESDLAVAEVHPGIGRPGGRTARNGIRDDTHLVDDVAPVLPTTANGRGTISNSRNPQARELLPGLRLVVNFHDDPGWDHSRLFSGQSMRLPGSSSLLTVTSMLRALRIIRGRECHPLVEAECLRLVLLNSIVVGLSMS